MPRIRKGTQSIKGGPIILKKTGKGGMRKIRCTNCHGMAAPMHRADGKLVTRCGTCGIELTSTAM